MAGGAGCTLFVRPEVGSPGTLVGGANAIPPVIAVGKASPGIAHDRGFDLPHFVDQLFADAMHIGNF